MIDVLKISKIEYRSDESLDIAPHIHKQAMEKISVNLSSEIIKIRDVFLQVIFVIFLKIIVFYNLFCFRILVITRASQSR